MWKEFKEFAFKGNVIDMAVGVMIGGAFSKIVTSLVNDLFMPALSLITGQVHLNGLFLALDGQSYPSIEAAAQAGVGTLNYGAFLQAVIDFLLIALCIFFFVKGINKLRSFKPGKPEAPAESKPAPRLCPYCFSEIHEKATRCPHCTAELK
jgi:large conductance mechanosensitive channel